MSRVLSCMLLSLGAATAQQCPLQFVGSVKQFVVEQENGKNRRTVPAVERPKTAKQFYDYRSASSHTGLEQVDKSAMFLYRDLNTDALSFFWIQGKESGRQGSAAVDGLISGIPAGVTIAQQDDHQGEFDWTTATVPGVITNSGSSRVGARWRFRINTDGGALDGLPTNLNWELKIEANFIRAINTWNFFFGDGSAPQEMDPAEPVYLHPVVTTVETGVAPYPAQPSTETFCTLVTSDVAETLKYTFIWGDDTPDTVVMKAAGELACADHDFCGPVSDTCGGTVPRQVRVSVEKDSCTIEKVLADEDIEVDKCVGASGPVVHADGKVVAGTDLMGAVNHNMLSKIPTNFGMMNVHEPASMPAGSVLELSCCGTEVCEFVVSHYHCPPCSGSVNGGFPAILPPSGFETGSCAPRYGATEEKMTSYRLQVGAGQTVSVPTTTEASSFVVFSQQGALDDPWCPKPARAGCGGPCPPSFCKCL